MKFEFCCKCDEPTGKTGAGEDSLYTAHEGPFCEDCFPKQSTEQERKEFAVHAVDIARRAVQEEREACAKIADEWAVGWPHPSQVIAERIRARLKPL